MFEWHMSVQDMVDCVEESLTEPLTLEMLAGRLNYSPYYCTRQFHKYAGISLRNYIRLRKVSSAVIDLRDTCDRIIDIAVKYGFSSQEAFTRSFKKAYGMTPAEYRKMPKPLPLLIKRNVFNPYYLGLGEAYMNKNVSKDVTVSIQVVPAHKFIGVRNMDANGYWDFWKLDEAEYGKDRCEEVDGILASIKSFNGPRGARFYRDGKKRGYMYGIDVPANYAGEVPKGMEMLNINETSFAVFHHPPYDYLTLDKAVFEALDKALEQWNPSEHGYEWNDDLPTYQRHESDKWGQAFMRPLRKSR